MVLVDWWNHVTATVRDSRLLENVLKIRIIGHTVLLL